ncbi:MAG: zf-HC2 domain-containing protein [Gemmataceae bacterium]|jgi:ferric-dicitrate binding protein FerR (iron transport regulator)|nr:zf-HC2 domain-containing protein [Gemmataceae bacterium]MBJ7430540.1 zf-HC2 domain-containing protein [Gemmataceae bacterium]MBJ7497659.1 zf-HC2 domain-containing protein [Gemmataceae bacterium]
MNEPEEADDSLEKEELYSSYLDGELTEEEAREFEAKLASSPEERANFQAMKKTWEMLDYLPKPDVTMAFTAKTMEKMRALSNPTIAIKEYSYGDRRLLVAAVLLILFVGGFGIGSYSLRKTVSIEEEIIRNFGLYENKKIYEQIENIEFLKKLDAPDLFGQDPSGL